jgi:hypothetical protein
MAFEEPAQDLDEELEKIKEAYRRGIRPSNNPYAPGQRSVPIYGLEDASPPEWLEEQSPTVVLAPPRDRVMPEDRLGREYRQGFVGVSDRFKVDADGFKENVKVGLEGRFAFACSTNAS